MNRPKSLNTNYPLQPLNLDSSGVPFWLATSAILDDIELEEPLCRVA